MTAETFVNQASPTAETAPTADYVEMSDAYAELPKKEKTYSSDVDGLDKAAADLDKARSREEPEIVERKYIDYATGKDMPMNQTVSLERAADDLTRQRGFEAQQVEQVADAVTAIETDAARTGVTPQQLVEQKLAEQQQQTIEPQPESGMPPEVAAIAEELERSPALKKALTEEAQRIQNAHAQAESARQQYAQAIQQAHQVAVDFTIGNFPELNGLTAETLPSALRVLEQSNPQRFQAVVSQLAKLDQVAKANQQVQQQQQAARQQVETWAAAQDKVVDEYLKTESPEVVRSVKESLPKVLSHYGIDPQKFRQVISQVPLFRSAPMQRMLFDLAKTHVLRDAVATKADRSAPPIMRLGTAPVRMSATDADVEAAKARFLKNPDDVKAAAAYIQAKRARR